MTIYSVIFTICLFYIFLESNCMNKGLENYTKIIISIFIILISTNLQSQRRVKLPTSLNENSGLVFILKDTCLWINDSNNPAEIIQSDYKGNNLLHHKLNIKNNDWEDLTLDEAGNLYIADIGNNALDNKYHTIYKLNKGLSLQDSFVFTYMNPPGEIDNSFDSESIVWMNGKLHIFTKGITKRKYFKSHHYIFNPSKLNSTAQYIESIDLKGFVFTGAAVSPDMKTLAICAYRYKYVFGFLPDADSKIFFYDVSNNEDAIFSKSKGSMIVPTWFITRQYESIDYQDDKHVLLAAEKTLFLKPLLRRVKVRKHFK